ncbi:ROK family protein [Photobacterium kagoshimensis]|uniref:ROK family protein n=1 Tax=Photobacterium kagoshimensis TaxID=2910242 RepID=UPI003D0D9405
MEKFNWGIDLGGTKIECAVLDKVTGKCVLRERIATEREQGYQHILSQIQRLVLRCADSIGSYPDKIGFGTPGTLDPNTQVMKNCNSTELNGQPLDADLQQLLNVTVVLANDANCFALAESRLGVVQTINPQAELVFGIIMGTGVGAGVVVNGKVLQGCHGIAGEWGHNVLDPQGEACYCGKRGCVETVLSGPRLEAYYHQLSGTACRLPEIVTRAKQQEPAGLQTLNRLVEQFGLAVASIINVLDPEVIVIGGGVGNIDYLYEKAETAILPHLFNPTLATRIVKPTLGDSAGVFGAAMLVMD